MNLLQCCKRGLTSFETEPSFKYQSNAKEAIKMMQLGRTYTVYNNISLALWARCFKGEDIVRIIGQASEGRKLYSELLYHITVKLLVVS